MEQRYERDDQKIDWLEGENRRLYAELETAKRREVSEEFLHKLDAVIDERDGLVLQVRDLQNAVDRANAAMLKHQKHNGALEIAIQEAHRDTDAASRLIDELKAALQAAVSEIREHHLEYQHVTKAEFLTACDKLIVPGAEVKQNPEPCGEVFEGEQKCLLPKPCRLHTVKRNDLVSMKMPTCACRCHSYPNPKGPCNCCPDGFRG